MSVRHRSHDVVTSQLTAMLLAGNILAVLCVAAFNPLSRIGAVDSSSDLVLIVGLLSLLATALLFLAPAMLRDGKPWWLVVFGLNAVQIVRLVPAVAAIVSWPQDGGMGALLWAFVLVPFFGLLSALCLVMTLRELRKSRRRRLAAA